MIRPTPRCIPSASIAALALLLAGCYSMIPSSGGGQTKSTGPRTLNAADIALPPGYRAQVVATGLNFPSGVAFDEDNRPYVVEAGYSYGEKFTTPRLLRIESNGKSTLIAQGKNAPWTGIVYSDGSFYIAQAGDLEQVAEIRRVRALAGLIGMHDGGIGDGLGEPWIDEADVGIGGGGHGGLLTGTRLEQLCAQSPTQCRFQPLVSSRIVGSGRQPGASRRRTISMRRGPLSPPSIC